MQKKNTKKIKSGNNDAGTNFFYQNNYGVNIKSITEPEYASSYGLIDAPAKQLCFSTNGVAASTDNIGPVIPNDFFFYTSNEVLKCVGYRTSWKLPSPIGLYVNQAGYLFYNLLREWELDPDRRWVNKCFFRRDNIGKGAYAVVQTSQHINSYNDGASLLGSISNWILTTLNLNTEAEQRSKFPKLVFNEPIFYIVPVQSPLKVGPSLMYSVKEGYNIGLKIMNLIAGLITNTSEVVPLSEFKFYFRSNDPKVATIGNGNPWGPIDIINFISSGTFILVVEQRFYQNRALNVAFLQQFFEINIQVTVNP